MSKCPKCGQDYPELFALSRDDHKTKICDLCGLREALDATPLSEERKAFILKNNERCIKFYNLGLPLQMNEEMETEYRGYKIQFGYMDGPDDWIAICGSHLFFGYSQDMVVKMARNSIDEDERKKEWM